MTKSNTIPKLNPNLWHLNNTGQLGGTPGIDINAIPAWQDYSGSGIKVAVLDTGVDTTHGDLRDNYLSDLDFDFLNNIEDGSYLTQPRYDAHGTFVSGLIAANGKGPGVVGVAYDAKFTSYANFNGKDTFKAFAKAADAGFDVMNNSWGSDIPFSLTFQNAPGLEAELEYAVANGRNGLGLNLVFAAGNGFSFNESFQELGFEWSREFGLADTNTDSLQNSRFTITVGAVDQDGTYRSPGEALGYTTPGASVLVSAPGTNVVSTDIQGAEGYNPNGDVYYSSGTSFASPIVSGVIALILEANPGLGYRDVKKILAYSARWNDQSEPDWMVNGATTHNGGGLLTNVNYGFGLVDATAAVRLAETWQTQSTLINETRVTGSPMTSVTAIPDESFIEFDFTLASGVDIESMELDFAIQHQELGDLIITLISPAGTESSLLYRLGDGRISEFLDAFHQRGEDAEPVELQHTFTSTQFMGESSGGVWTVRVEDAKKGDVGSVHWVGLKAYGARDEANETYIFTNDFGTVAAIDPSRQTVSNNAGSHTLNFAAVTDAIRLDLGDGSGLVAGSALTIAADTAISAVFTGDGSDLITLSEVGETVSTGRGSDTIVVTGTGVVDGGMGTDRVMLSAEREAYAIEAQDSALNLTMLQGGGTILARNVQYFDFADGADVLIAAVDGMQRQVASLYETLLGRAADFDGLVYWFDALASGVSAEAIASSFAQSDEFLRSDLMLPDSDFLQNLYRAVLNRDSDQEGFGYWAAQLDQGVSQSAIATSFALSQEAGGLTWDSIILV